MKHVNHDCEKSLAEAQAENETLKHVNHDCEKSLAEAQACYSCLRSSVLTLRLFRRAFRASPQTVTTFLAAFESVARSGLFNAGYYRAKYADVQNSNYPPYLHFLRYGARELRKPHPLFDTEYYLSVSHLPLSRAHEILGHYQRIGQASGLRPNAFFDPLFYLSKNADVAETRLDPLVHYCTTGWHQGRNPSADFSTSTYLELNPDVAEAGLNPLEHYLEHGQFEGRRYNDHQRQSADNSSKAPTTPTKCYAEWIKKHDFDASRDVGCIRSNLSTLMERPLVSVVMPIYNTPEELLREAIDSVREQIYENWQLCIADDGSTESHVRQILTTYANKDKRIKVVFRESNGHICHATNSAFDIADGEWIALLDHDDVLRPHALAEVILEISRHPEAEIIYSDEDKLDSTGNRYDPFFKPDFSRELFRSQNFLNHLTVHRAANIRAVGGWRPGFEGSQDYDLALRIFERIDAKNIRHIPKILYHWRAIDGSTASSGNEKSYAYAAGLRALQEHVQRTGLFARVEPAPDSPFYRVRCEVPNPNPLVSLIIPIRDKVDLLRSCLQSIQNKTTYENYEIIIVDNGSRETETLDFLSKIERSGVRVLNYDAPFNYSAINNYAVERSNGTLIGLVNNDIEVISPEWLTEMVSWATQPDIGCVGAKLYYSNDTIQHAGVILGIGGVAGHSHKRYPRDHQGYFSRLKILQNLSAVTAACLVVRTDVYQLVGGLNEEHLAVAFNDVDFCLKVRAAGFLNVWTPYAEMYHHESLSRGYEDNPTKRQRFQTEVQYMRSVWQLHKDPYYSIHLTRDREDFSISVT